MPRNLVYLIWTYFLWVLFVTPVVAIDRSNVGSNSWLHQPQLVNLVKPSKLSEDSYGSLHEESKHKKLNRAGHSQADLKLFWQTENTPNDTNWVNNIDDLYQHDISLEPTSINYLPISKRLRYLLWLSQLHPWTPLVIEGLLKQGDHHKSIPEISLRLNMLGDLDRYDPNNKQLNRNIATSLIRFQRRHGLTPDAVIGPKTLKWLNVTPEKRSRLLASNFLKKSSYLASLGKRFLLINIPAFELILVDNDKVQLKSRVIVGKPYRQTPLLSSQISNVVLNPSWRVPRSLLRKDLLPKVRENGQYISQRNFDVFDTKGELINKSPKEWQALAHGRFPYRLVQRPGKENTLGRYKFYFENGYSVYLHDTVDKSLFDESNRALSSGCIRVENVEDLAHWMASNLVTDKQTWQAMQVDRQKTQWFALNDFLAIHLVYWTAWIDNDGISQFRNDIYNQNSISNAALVKNW